MSLLCNCMVQVFTAPGQPNYTSWLGAAVFGATDVVVTRSLSR